MTRPYQLQLNRDLEEHHPLHWRNFWPDLHRLHISKIAARQSLILWVANLHNSACKSPAGFNYTDLRLTDLRNIDREYRRVIDHFFNITQLGYCLSDKDNQVTRLVPKRLTWYEAILLDDTLPQIKHNPGQKPTGETSSFVFVAETASSHDIEEQLRDGGQYYLWPQVQWILERRYNKIEFIFQRSGKLLQRDTSIWPISAIETWPSWLREKLFGRGIDLDTAYVQFLLNTVQKAFPEDEGSSIIPDLYRMLDEKEKFRKELCEEVIGVKYEESSKRLLKKLLMAIANGSKITPSLLDSPSHSEAALITLELLTKVQTPSISTVGNRLHSISRQFAVAKKIACLALLKTNPNKSNQKKVFKSYFEWEREARYLIWEKCDRHGLMVHDGIDGIPDQYLSDIPKMMESLQLRLTAS